MFIVVVPSESNFLIGQVRVWIVAKGSGSCLTSLIRIVEKVTSGKKARVVSILEGKSQLECKTRVE